MRGCVVNSCPGLCAGSIWCSSRSPWGRPCCGSGRGGLQCVGACAWPKTTNEINSYQMRWRFFTMPFLPTVVLGPCRFGWGGHAASASVGLCHTSWSGPKSCMASSVGLCQWRHPKFFGQSIETVCTCCSLYFATHAVCTQHRLTAWLDVRCYFVHLSSFHLCRMLSSRPSMT